MTLFRSFFVAIICALASIWAVTTHASNNSTSSPPLAIELSAWRYSADEKQPIAADSAAPGETLNYQVRYFNQSRQLLANVMATLPIPVDMQLVSTESVQGLLASVDGKAFSRWPLYEVVITEDGQRVERRVPLSSIRQLRWSIPVLAPGAAAVFSADVQVKN